MRPEINRPITKYLETPTWREQAQTILNTKKGLKKIDPLVGLAVVGSTKSLVPVAASAATLLEYLFIQKDKRRGLRGNIQEASRAVDNYSYSHPEITRIIGMATVALATAFTVFEVFGAGASAGSAIGISMITSPFDLPRPRWSHLDTRRNHNRDLLN